MGSVGAPTSNELMIRRAQAQQLLPSNKNSYHNHGTLRNYLKRQQKIAGKILNVQIEGFRSAKLNSGRGN
jgi:hypothetical protein